MVHGDWSTDPGLHGTREVRSGRKPHGYYYYGLLLWNDLVQRAPTAKTMVPTPKRKPSQALNLVAYVHKKRNPRFQPARQGDVIEVLRTDGLDNIAGFLVRLGVSMNAPLPHNPDSRVGGSHLLSAFYRKLDASMSRTLPTFSALPSYHRIGLLPLLWQVSTKHSVSIDRETSFLAGYALVTEADTSDSKVAKRLGRSIWNMRHQQQLEELQSFEREDGFGEIWLYKAFPRSIDWVDGQLRESEWTNLATMKWLEVLGQGRPFAPAFEHAWLAKT